MADLIETFEYVLPQRRYRVLLDTGRVVDVLAVWDDSNMRGWLIDQLGNDSKIIGVTQIADQGTLL